MKNIVRNSFLVGVILSSVTASGIAFAGSTEIGRFQALEIGPDISFPSVENASGYHWVNPYLRNDGTFVTGHWRSNPDGFCWNNLSGC